VSSLADERDDRGRRLVVRSGHAVSRSVVTGAGPTEIRTPRVRRGLFALGITTETT